MKPEAERNWLDRKIISAFSGGDRPSVIDMYPDHEENDIVAFLEKSGNWEDIDIKALVRVPHYAIGFMHRLSDESFKYYTPLILRAGVTEKPNSFAYNELLFEFIPPETQELYSAEDKARFRRRMALFSPEQMNVIADVIDYQSRVELNWPARQAFEAYWHTFATRQPEIWEPWIK